MRYHPQRHEVASSRRIGDGVYWVPLTCNACVLGNVDEARKLLDKAIELRGKEAKQRALEDAVLERL